MTGLRQSVPSGGGATRAGSRAMRAVVGLLLTRTAVAVWIFAGTELTALEEARLIGQRAKSTFISRVVGVSDHRKRNTYYLDGLEECNNIDRNWTDHIEDQALRYGRVPDAVWLEKAGMKQFTALFMTIPPYHMERTARAACSKHEKQLTCGAEYEGVETTQGRIEELKTIGNHRMMFEKECSDPKFVSRVYPCVGGDVQQWMQPCADQVNSYSAVRESVNARIAHIYDNAIEIIKDLISEDKSSGASVFDHAMSSIARLEGTKCGLFKKMRVCVLRQLLQQCGVEAVKAFNTSISLGYLRTERRERLNLDFKVFNYPVHPNCIGL